jgi:hypothetical protein
LVNNHAVFLLISCTAFFDNKRRHFLTLLYSIVLIIKDDIHVVGKPANVMMLQTLKKLKKDRCGKHLAAPTLIVRLRTIHSVGVSGKEIELIQDGGQSTIK